VIFQDGVDFTSDIELRKQKEFLEWMKRTAHERLSEREVSTQSLKLDFKCSRTREDWTVLLQKEIDSNLFEFVRIITTTTMSQSKSGASSISKPTAVDMNKIKNRSSIKCPHCGDGRWVKCGCGRLSCEGGLTERDGGEWHVCPWCGEGGFLEGTFKTIDGEMEDRRRLSGPEDKPSLPRPYKSLPP